MEKPDATGFMNRRQLLQSAAASALLISFPGTGGCSSLPKYRQVIAGEGKALILINGQVIDVVSGDVQRGKTIVIRNGVIEAVTDEAPVAQNGQLVYDLKYQYVIPGLIDAHCHTTLTSESRFDLFGALTTYGQIKRNYFQQFAHGVTTVRDMGAMPKLLSDAIRMIERHELIGPRVIYCNAFTNLYRSHPDIDPGDVSIFSGMAIPFIGNPNLWFKDTDELKKKMAQNSAGGASFIKLTMDSQSVMCGLGKIPVYADEHLHIIREFARERNLSMAGHVHTKFGFDRAVQHGLDSIEHSLGDARLSDEEVLGMAKKQIAIVPTMIVAQMLAAEEAYAELPPLYRTDFIAAEMADRRQYLKSCTDQDIDPDIHRANMASLINFQKYGCENLYRQGKFMARPDLYFSILLHGPANLMKMKQAGILIGCGTDSGVPYLYHGTLWREMEMLSRIGFTNKEILQCATINNARILRLADKIGTIEKGKFADLAVFKKNPLEKIEACRSPELVIKDGRVYDVTQKT
ncbi:MAG: amidohydrolase family protein [Deltaproteobacteria bacterium]